MARQVVEEILSTETRFVNSLETVVEIFLKPLNNAALGMNPILGDQEIAIIFGNIEDILMVNQQLLKALNERIVQEKRLRVGDLILNMVWAFKFYTKYITGYERAAKTLKECENSKKQFRNFLTDVCSDGRVGGLNLESYLIMPVQRIPRYKLLLETLLKYTDERNEDYQDLLKAQKEVDQVAKLVNESVRQKENDERLSELGRRLGVELFEPSRRILREGDVMKICRKAHKKYRLVLCNDILFYYESEPSGGWLLGARPRLFNLLKDGIRVHNIHNSERVSNVFQIHNKKKPFTLYTSNELEKDNWMRDIRVATGEIDGSSPQPLLLTAPPSEQASPVGSTNDIPTTPTTIASKPPPPSYPKPPPPADPKPNVISTMPPSSKPPPPSHAKPPPPSDPKPLSSSSSSSSSSLDAAAATSKPLPPSHTKPPPPPAVPKPNVVSASATMDQRPVPVLPVFPSKSIGASSPKVSQNQPQPVNSQPISSSKDPTQALSMLKPVTKTNPSQPSQPKVNAAILSFEERCLAGLTLASNSSNNSTSNNSNSSGRARAMTLPTNSTPQSTQPPSSSSLLSTTTSAAAGGLSSPPPKPLPVPIHLQPPKTQAPGLPPDPLSPPAKPLPPTPPNKPLPPTPIK